MEEFVTACPRNCYSTCTFRVQVENNQIRRILPYSGNLATPEGPCIKGLSYIERTNSPERIIHPLRKNSKGQFEEINSEEALDIIANELSLIKEKWGSHSILWYRGSGMSGLTNEIGNTFWKAFGGTTITYGNLCWPAGLEAVRLTMGSVKHNVPWDLVNAKTIIIWGKNPAETNIQEISFIAAAREKGCRIIVIDPLRTPTADKADILLSPKPGTDGALALALAKLLIDNDLIDHEFIAKNVKGYKELKQSLHISPDVAELITGIPAENIIELACLIGKNGPMTILPGYGLQRHQNGGQTIRSVLLLSVLTGNIGRPGSGFNYANLQSYVFDDIKEPISYYPDPEQDKPFRRSISMAKLGAGMLNTSDPELKAAWADGAIYGTTTWGGHTNDGTVFRLNLDGSGYTVLHHFAWDKDSDGSHPFAGLAGRGGVLYGTTEGGGAIGFGTVYRLALLPELQIALTGQGAQVTVTGYPDQSCWIQATTNFTSWVTATNLVLTNGTGQFSEPINSPRRFYRALVR